MSKLCKTEENADESIEYYNRKGIDACKKLNSEGLWIIYNSDTGKVLKGMDFYPPDLKEIL